MKKELIELRVNGREHELAIEPSELLLDEEGLAAGRGSTPWGAAAARTAP